MPSAALVYAPEDQQVRSYHRAFLGELTLYTFGGDLRPWRPIPARGVFWAAGAEFVVFVLAHLIGLSLAFGTLAWGFLYLGVPFATAWLFTVARVEGRRLHVALVAWARHAVLGDRLAGGYQRLGTARPVGPSRIRLSPTYEAPRRRINRRYAIATLPLLALIATAWIALTHRTPTRTPAIAAAVVAPAPRLRITFRTPAPLRLHVRVHRIVPKPVRPSRARSVRRPTVRLHSTPPPKRTVAPVPPQTPVVIARPTSPAPSVTVAPAPIPRPTPTCYPGELGC